MSMYNLIECSDNYTKTSGNLWQYYRDKPNVNLTYSESFRSKTKIKGRISAEVFRKYLSNFWRTLEMLLINCNVNRIVGWSADCVISSATGATKFAIHDTKLYVSLVTGINTS